ncbi:MAG TPA: transporter, partial [Planctomycetaceae bacterium]|nr:transporter [Planctomycetaceae bacterium]
IANGERLAAWGSFDTKVKASTENGPVGFYETYRHRAGLSNPIYSGGEFFAGYRSGRGDFQPWYGERETNDGGEFKAGVRVPLMRDREIDTRRAQLWRATYNQQIAAPVIRAALVAFAREAGHAYWKWVAAGQKYQVGKLWLDLAQERNEKIETRVKAQDLDPPELIDNERAIAKREAKLADSLRELQQAAVKLSLYLRDDSGTPIVLTIEDVPEFPLLRLVDPATVDSDIAKSLTTRPELTELNLQLQRLRVDHAEASNMTQPGLDAMLVGSQDVGAPTSSKRDKSEFEVEAGLYFDVPLQRRKGLGKMNAVQAKIAQVNAKRQMVSDKITAEVRFAFAGLIQTHQEVLKAREAVRLARRMATIERRKFELGESDLLKVALREQYSLEAAEEAISATLGHFQAFSNYAAALAVDRPDESLLPADLPLE